MSRPNGKPIITAAMKSDRGMVRERNEDACLVNDALGLMMVADGLGGHAGAKRASWVAVQTLMDSMEDLPACDCDHVTVESVITEAFAQASSKIREVSRKDYHMKDMATTAVAAWCCEDSVWVAHLGDSRAYLVQGGKLTQLTHDHSMVEELVRAGYLSAEEGQVHPQRHVVTRSLGPTEGALPTILRVEWRVGDTLLLCTDGLTNMLSHRDIETLLQDSAAEVHGQCARLIEATNEHGGFDNVTVALARHL